MIKIGNINIDGKSVLAPMAGVTDLAYREICAEMGASYFVTEMLSSKAIQYNHKKTFGLAMIGETARPCAIQLFGDEPSVMALAAKRLMEFAPDAIDINMGCPVPKIAGNNSGSSLMRDPELCGEIVSQIKNTVDIPVTVKIRKGWDDDNVNAVEIAQVCEKAGASAIAVHGRTKKQMYTGKADWDIIRQVKQNVNIPVIGNGDIFTAQDAAGMLEETGCDLVMPARGALGNPWIFREINAYLSGNPCIMPAPVLSERILVIRKHIGLLCRYKGEERGMKEARKHVSWYLHGMKGAAAFRNRAGTLSRLDDLDVLLKDIYRENISVI